MSTIRVKYSCHTCGLEKVECDVPAREDVTDVVFWVEYICGRAVQEDHTRRSPECDAESVQDLMIPISGADYIGGPCKQ